MHIEFTSITLIHINSLYSIPWIVPRKFPDVINHCLDKNDEMKVCKMVYMKIHCLRACMKLFL